MLLDRARSRREYCVGVGTDQTDRTDDNDENHRQHNRILGDILGFVLPQYVPEKISHLPPPVSEVRVATANECQEGWGQRRESELDRERMAGLHPKCTTNCALLVSPCQANYNLKIRNKALDATPFPSKIHAKSVTRTSSRIRDLVTLKIRDPIAD